MVFNKQHTDEKLNELIDDDIPNLDDVIPNIGRQSRTNN